MIIETTEYNTKITILVVRWYFIEMPTAIFYNTIEYMKSLAYIFSFIFLIKTLVSPWKNQLYAYPSKGLDLKKVTEVFISNSVSRIVGLVMRTFVILIGVLLEVLVFLLGITFFIVWFLFPLVFILSIIGSL